MVKNVGELFKSVEELKIKGYDELWFRGHCRSDFELIPGIYRKPLDGSREEGLINDFYAYSPTKLKRPPVNPWEWSAIMQHYGLPTRLLDWSESYLVALYFALDGWDDRSKSIPHIWVMDPCELNARYQVDNVGYPLLGDSPKYYPWIPETLWSDPTKSEMFKPYWDPKFLTDLGKYPVAMVLQSFDERLVSQRGAFTLHGSYTEKLEIYAAENHFKKLIKIEIDCTSRDEHTRWMNELDEAGVNASTIYPDVTGLCRYLTWDYKFNFRS